MGRCDVDENFKIPPLRGAPEPPKKPSARTWAEFDVWLTSVIAERQAKRKVKDAPTPR